MTDKSVVVIYCIILLESLIIFLANTFTVFVFWKNRNKLKRTSFLLINLAVADLLVGLSQMIRTGGIYIQRYTHNKSTLGDDILKKWILAVPSLCSPYASLFFLVLISLERAYALIWPLRHRVASFRGYIYSAIFVWAAATTLGALTLLIVKFKFLNLAHWMAALACIAALSLTTVCACYVTIRARLSSNARATVANKDNTLEQNRKLSRTLFIVIGASLVCWGSSSVAYFIFHQCLRCYPRLVLESFHIFHLGNSLVNPIIYSFKFPMFRKVLKRMRLRITSKQYRVS